MTTLSDLITATGFRRRVLQWDMQATINRINYTWNVNEMDELNHDQLIMMLIVSGDFPGSPRLNSDTAKSPQPTPRTYEHTNYSPSQPRRRSPIRHAGRCADVPASEISFA